MRCFIVDGDACEAGDTTVAAAAAAAAVGTAENEDVLEECEMESVFDIEEDARDKETLDPILSVSEVWDDLSGFCDFVLSFDEIEVMKNDGEILGCNLSGFDEEEATDGERANPVLLDSDDEETREVGETVHIILKSVDAPTDMLVAVELVSVTCRGTTDAKSACSANACGIVFTTPDVCEDRALFHGT